MGQRYTAAAAAGVIQLITTTLFLRCVTNCRNSRACKGVQYTRRCRRFKAGMVGRICSTTRKYIRVPACNSPIKGLVQNIL